MPRFAHDVLAGAMKTTQFFVDDPVASFPETILIMPPPTPTMLMPSPPVASHAVYAGGPSSMPSSSALDDYTPMSSLSVVSLYVGRSISARLARVMADPQQDRVDGGEQSLFGIKNRLDDLRRIVNTIAEAKIRQMASMIKPKTNQFTRGVRKRKVTRRVQQTQSHKLLTLAQLDELYDG